MQTYGHVNAHLIGIAMKEMVQRAIRAIRTERFVFVATAKKGHSGEMDDVVTSADHAAQKIYVKLMRESFPTFGIVAEEDNLSVPCTDPALGDIYFTCDPLDGTKAFERRQSHGIGSMISLVHNGQIIAACIGDVMTQEIYYYRPESQAVHRLSENGRAETLAFPKDEKLSELYVLLRQRPEGYGSPLFESLLAPPEKGGAFKDIEITGGSIGISMARLWKGEVGAAIVSARNQTPWDVNPVIGICEKLGFVFLKPNGLHPTFVERKLTPLKETIRGEGYELVIHRSLVPQLNDWTWNYDAKSRGL
jgi:fructose-1,6-bisphosphatase/inositol monophosphatase family enzyme